MRLEFLEELKNNLDDTVETFLNEISTHFNKSKEEVEKAQDTRLNELREEKFDNLIIFIDELDRCRPTYALKIIEMIKYTVIHI